MTRFRGVRTKGTQMAHHQRVCVLPSILTKRQTRRDVFGFSVGRDICILRWVEIEIVEVLWNLNLLKIIYKLKMQRIREFAMAFDTVQYVNLH